MQSDGAARKSYSVQNIWGVEKGDSPCPCANCVIGDSSPYRIHTDDFEICDECQYGDKIQEERRNNAI